jgi:hypothetical protein
VRRQLHGAVWSDKQQHKGTLSLQKAPFSLLMIAAYEDGSRNKTFPLSFIVYGGATNTCSI